MRFTCQYNGTDTNVKVPIQRVSNPQDCTKRITLCSLGDVFNRTPPRLLWEVGSHAALNTRRVFIHKCPLSIDGYSFIQMSELEQCGVDKFAKDLTQ